MQAKYEGKIKQFHFNSNKIVVTEEKNGMESFQLIIIVSKIYIYFYDIEISTIAF